MEKDFFNSDFEQFLKENVEQYRMYPSDSVWNNIYSSMHFGSRLLGFGFTLLMLSLGSFSIYLLNAGKNDKAIANVAELVMPADLSEIANSSTSQIATVNYPVKNISKPTETNRTSVPSVNIALDNLAAAISADEEFNNSSISEEFVYLEDEFINPDIHTQELNTSVENPETISTLSKINDQPIAMPAALDKAIRSLTLGKTKNKTAYQFYFTPTVTTRKLSENKSYVLNGTNSILSLTAANINSYNVNELVNHNPELGIEFGLTGIIPISNKLNLRAGLQFNVSRYSIKAFNIQSEIATYALNRGTRVDSLSMVSNYRNNQSGYNPDNLQNFYFQASAPIGVEYLFAQKDNVSFGIAGTIQPTYILNNKVYLLSVDYKNYTEVPWLIRRVNANTSIETFVSYSTGKLKWQIGPQIRYQLLSSYIDKYPVKENLLNYGFKVGASLNR
jgi:hypothetical protein